MISHIECMNKEERSGENGDEEEAAIKRMETQTHVPMLGSIEG